MIARQIVTTPSAGKVSSPENGGASSAHDREGDDDEPDRRGGTSGGERVAANRGRERFSNQRTRRMMNGTALPVIVAPSSRLLPLLREPDRPAPEHHLERDDEW